ncbi:hypothetical protein [Dyadobacter sp.]|nr:hypothetical protein [Dyadobacter sp.]
MMQQTTDFLLKNYISMELTGGSEELGRAICQKHALWMRQPK